MSRACAVKLVFPQHLCQSQNQLLPSSHVDYKQNKNLSEIECYPQIFN